MSWSVQENEKRMKREWKRSWNSGTKGSGSLAQWRNKTKWGMRQSVQYNIFACNMHALFSITYFLHNKTPTFIILQSFVFTPTVHHERWEKTTNNDTMHKQMSKLHRTTQDDADDCLKTWAPNPALGGSHTSCISWLCRCCTFRFDTNKIPHSVCKQIQSRQIQEESKI